MMVAEEELKALKAARLNRVLAENSNTNLVDEPGLERSACLIALLPPNQLATEEAISEAEADEKLLLTDDGDTWQTLVGTLDVHAVRAMPDETLIGNCENAAYLANVCTNPLARRRGVGEVCFLHNSNLFMSFSLSDLTVHVIDICCYAGSVTSSKRVGQGVGS